MAMRRSRGTTPVKTAEGIGAALRHVAARLEAWKQQRAEIADDLHTIVKSAQALLGELGDVAPVGPASSVRPPSSGARGGRPKGYKTSEETRRKLRAAWKRRKAAQMKEQITD